MSIDEKLRVEDKLLIYCARTHIESRNVEKIRGFLKQDLNWDYLINLASDHSLTSLLFFQLNHICPELVPIHFMDHLRDHFTRNTHRNLLMMSELFRILKLLDSEGIKAIPYKGPVLAVGIFGSLSLREFADLDIFVDKKNVLKVKEILVSEGYEPNLKLSKERETHYLKVQREYQFFNIEKGVSVEIQWNLTDLSISFPIESVFIMDQISTKYEKINNNKISVFSDEDLLLILSLHTVTHLWGKLSWICDIAELIKNSQKLNWDRIIEKSRKLAVERILYLNLALSNELFDTELPEEVKLKINSDKKIKYLKHEVLRIIFEHDDYGFFKKFILRFKIREKNENKFKDFIKLLLIPTSTEWKTFQRSIPLKLLYLLARPIQIFNKAIR